MSESVVDKLHVEFADIKRLLESAKELSLLTTVDEGFRKMLLLSVASYFEHKLSDSVFKFAIQITDGEYLIPELVRNKAISRQYHTWFDWEKSNANKFFSMFGSNFISHMQKLQEKDPQISQAIKDFMELGRDRNRLVHQNFASFPLEKTAEEIYAAYRSALRFVDIVGVELSACSAALRGSAGNGAAPAAADR